MFPQLTENTIFLSVLETHLCERTPYQFATRQKTILIGLESGSNGVAIPSVSTIPSLLILESNQFFGESVHTHLHIDLSRARFPLNEIRIENSHLSSPSTFPIDRLPRNPHRPGHGHPSTPNTSRSRP